MDALLVPTALHTSFTATCNNNNKCFYSNNNNSKYGLVCFCCHIYDSNYYLLIASKLESIAAILIPFYEQIIKNNNLFHSLLPPCVLLRIYYNEMHACRLIRVALCVVPTIFSSLPNWSPLQQY